MTNSKTLFLQLQKEITLPEDVEEISNQLYLVFEKELGLTRTDIMMEKPVQETHHQKLNEIVARINKHEPVQYILGEAHFCGRSFLVNPAVLIPRPETELIIMLAKEERYEAPTILDVGTGSGCLAISLALEIPTAHVIALDVSQKALAVAKENADRLGAYITFMNDDFLKDYLPLKDLDLIVSNPPYIMESERPTMSPNVLNYEPPLALFVPNNDPLVFYKEIAKKGKKMLRPGGKIIVEINEKFGKEVKSVFEQLFFRATIIPDLNGKERIVMAHLV